MRIAALLPCIGVLLAASVSAQSVSAEVAEACAKWAGKELPTEAGWKFAARGGPFN